MACVERPKLFAALMATGRGSSEQLRTRPLASIGSVSWKVEMICVNSACVTSPSDTELRFRETTV